MKKVLASLGLILCVGSCSAPEGSRAAPEISLTRPAGDRLSLSSHKGRVVLLNFWATWCDSCKVELPVLKELNRRQKGRFELLAVSVDVNPTKTVPAFVALHGIDFPVVYASQEALERFGVRDLPTSFLIDASGDIVRRYVGPLDERAVENDIVRLLDRRPS